MAITSGRDKVFKLIARGTELDLFQDETIFLSNNVTGLFDIGKLPSDFTRQITIPGTKRNNEFFQHVYDISIDEPYLFKTNTKVIAQFDFDGFYVSQGYMQLERVNLKENKYVESYEVSIYGLLSSFKRDLQSLTLNELNTLDKYNHIFSGGNILHSWSGSAYDGNSHLGNQIFTSSVDGHNLGGEIVYTLTDSGKQHAYQAQLPNNILGINYSEIGPFGPTSLKGGLHPQDYKPAIRLDKVVDAIFDETEYTYESTFLSESRFDNTYVLCDRGLKYPIISGVNLETQGQIEIGPISGSGTPVTITSAATGSLLFENVYYDGSFNINNNSQYEPNFGQSAVQSSAALVELTLNMKITGSNTVYPKLYLYRQDKTPGGSAPGWQRQELPFMNQVIKQNVLNGSGDVDLTLTEETEFTFNSGSYKYEFNLGFDSIGTGTTNVIVGPEGNEESRLKVKTLFETGELLPINISNNMPFGTSGITLLDFLTSVQKKFNLQIYPSKTKPRHFIIETFNNWYKQGKVKNFDNYMDLNQRISVTPANNLGVREVEFGDTLDVDFLAQNFNKENNREFGKSYFRDTQNFFSDGKLEVKSGFGVSPLRYVAGSGVTGSAGTPLTPFIASLANTTVAVCAMGQSTYYHNGSGSTPDVGDTIYSDANGDNPLGSYQYMVDDFTPDIYIIGANGVVLSTDGGGTCISGGAPES
jgi:hypothetical protein